MTTPTLTSLAKMMRDLAANAQAPEGQPNDVADNYGEVAALLESFINIGVGITRRGRLTEAIKQHNIQLVDTCNANRADTRTPCGGKKGVRCGDCPRTLGLTGGNRTITG